MGSTLVSAGAASYQVHLGTTRTPGLVATVTGTSYSPGMLASNTKYHWYVVAVNSLGTAASAKSVFTTDAPATSMPTAQNGTVSPASGNGSSQTFAFTFPAAGFTAGTVIFNSTLQYTQACWIVYDAASSHIWLASDDTATWTNGAPGSSGVLQNSQCSISLANSLVRAFRGSIRAKIAVSFQPGFSGTRNIYMSVSSGGTATPLTQAGSWIVP